MNLVSASVHAVIGPVGGSPNLIVCYMLRGSRLTLLHLLVEGLIYLTGAMFGRSPMPLLLKSSCK